MPKTKIYPDGAWYELPAGITWESMAGARAKWDVPGDLALKPAWPDIVVFAKPTYTLAPEEDYD